jgi:Ca2+-binding RTX toxin-like protein
MFFTQSKKRPFIVNNSAENKIILHTVSSQVNPQITAPSDVGWLTTFQSNGLNGSGIGVYFRSFENLPGGDETIDGTYAADTITFTSLSTKVNAGEGANTITGTSGNNLIIAGSGADTITFTSGNNTIEAGDGANTITATSGDNSITSGSGADTITVTSGDNTIHAGDGANTITATSGVNTITTGFGANTITTSGIAGGDDIMTDGPMSDDFVFSEGLEMDGISNFDVFDGTIIASSGNTITTGSGADTITVTSGDNTIHAGNGANTITATSGNNTITTGSGADTITVTSGDNTIEAGDGANTITATSGLNTITTGSGADTITTGGLAGSGNTIDAGDGANTITTGDGSDMVTGGNGVDTITTGGGDDIINAGGGDDIMTGGAGSDDFIFEDGFGNDSIIDFEAFDGAEVIILSNVTGITDYSDLTANHLTANASGDAVIFDGADTITLTGVLIADLDAINFFFLFPALLGPVSVVAWG